MTVAACALASASAWSAHAAPEPGGGDFFDLSLLDLLDRPTVTASGGEVEQRANAAANLVSILRSDIVRNGWQSVGEAVASAPGVYLIDAGTGPSIGVRGVTGGLRSGTRLVKVMINGMPVNFRPDLRAFLGPEFLPLEAVERIEIAMGPLSALYGANAFIATINVITRTVSPGATAEAAGIVQRLDGSGQLGYRISGMASYGWRNVTALVAASTASLDQSGRNIQQTYPAQDPTDDRFRLFFAEASRGDVSTPSSAFAQVRILDTPAGVLTIEGGVQRLVSSAEFELNSTLTHLSAERLVNGWMAAKLEKKWSDRFSSTLTVGVSSGAPAADEQFFLTGTQAHTFKRNFGYRALDIGLTSYVSLGPRLTLRLSVDTELDREKILYYTEIFNRAEGTRQPGDRLDLIADTQPKYQLMSDFGADLQVSGTPFERLDELRLTASARVDRVSYGSFGPPLQPSVRLAGIYRWQQGRVAKLIIGRAFQTPSGVLMFAQPGFGAANNVIGNLNAVGVPALRPQHIESAELIFYGLVTQRAVIEVSGFYQILKDEIEFRTTGTDYVARNGADSSFAGAETAVHLDFGSVKPFLTAAMAAPMRGGKPTLSASAAYPTLMGTAGVDVDLLRERLHLNGRLRYVGERGATSSNVAGNFGRPYTLAPFATVDLTVSTSKLFSFGKTGETRFVLSATNLLNHIHSEPGFGGYDLPVPGRRVLLEARQTF
jgi:outer membrane receptor protein involved in Fe transport